MTVRVWSDEEIGEVGSLERLFSGQDKARRAAGLTPAHCLCGRFARFVRYEANTMPNGESVTTVHCKRCGEVKIR
jgi:hypothetical protein